MEKFKLVVTCLLGCALSSAAHAIAIQSQLSPLGGNQYRYVYTVKNDSSLGAGVAVRLFDIAFDPAKYRESSLKVVTPAPLNTQWNGTILFSAPGDPAAYSSFSSTTSIVPGATASGFSVEFEWIGGAGGPTGSQQFQIFDPNNFSQLEQGTTTTRRVQSKQLEDVPTLSEWAMILLMLLLVGLAFLELRKRHNLIGG